MSSLAVWLLDELRQAVASPSFTIFPPGAFEIAPVSAWEYLELAKFS